MIDSQMTFKHGFIALVLGSVCTLTGVESAGQEGDRRSSKNIDGGGHNSVSFEVKDSTGAAIPNAHIVILDQSDGLTNGKKSDALGRAEFVLARNRQYKATVSANGFNSFVESFELESDITIAVVLKVGFYSGPIVVEPETAIPLEHSYMVIELPMQPLNLLQLQPRRIRHGHHP